SYCILIGKKLDDISEKRMEVICSTTDGFKIADADLKLRGPGEFFGIRQSGALTFSCTDLQRDKKELENARKTAFEIVEKDPQLRKPENALIKKIFLEKYGDSIRL